MTDPREPRSRRFPGDPVAVKAPAARTAPELTREVVEWLEANAPEVRPNPDTDLGALWHAHGRRSMAVHARAAYERQMENQ